MKKKFDFYFILMYFSFFIYSLSVVFLKKASCYYFLSLNYCLFLELAIIMLGIYAFFWQMVLKKMDLSVAMAHKPIVLVLGILWACFLFKETISLNVFWGCLCIFTGIFIIGKNS